MVRTVRCDALHSLLQLRAHRETTILVATSIARDVYKPDPPACAPHRWRATSKAGMDYCGVKEKSMEPLTIIGGVIAATGAGLGIGVGARLLPLAFRAHLDLQAWKRSEESNLRRRIADHEKERLLPASPHGRKRDSSIAGVSGGALRHTDGLTRARGRRSPRRRCSRTNMS